MGFQYDNVPRATEVERKLQAFSENKSEYGTQQIQKVLSKPVEARLSPALAPNKDFIEAYKRRELKLNEERKKENFLNSIDEQGHKLEKVYLNKDYIQLHDPLNLYHSKQNYEDLAWKVFRDVDANNVFLKTLYYPLIRSEDYNALIAKFGEIHASSKVFNKFSLLGGVASVGAGYFVSTKLSFKARTAVLLSGLTGVAGYCIVNSIRRSISQSRLNKFAQDISSKYSDVNFTNVEFRRINH